MIRKPEDIYDALKIMVLTNPFGKSDKEIAVEVRPDLPVEQACCNAEMLINFLSDEFGFERPAQKLVLTPEKELKVIRQILKEKGIEVDVKEYVAEHREVVSLEIEREPSVSWWMRVMGMSGRG